jgi:hypothetical protein
MRIANITWPLYRRILIPATIRDLGILVYLPLRELTSLPALTYVFKHWKRLWARRKTIQSRRRVSEEYIASYCAFKPVSKPLDPHLLAKLR